MGGEGKCLVLQVRAHRPSKTQSDVWWLHGSLSLASSLSIPSIIPRVSVDELMVGLFLF